MPCDSDGWLIGIAAAAAGEAAVLDHGDDVLDLVDLHRESLSNS